MTLLVVGFAHTTDAALISFWGFDTAPTTSPITATSGVGSQPSATLTVNTGAFGSTTGTTVNDPRGTPAATFALQFTASGGGSYTLQLSGTGLSSFTITYAGRKDTGSGGTQFWEWSTDNTTFSSTGVTQPAALGAAFATETVSFTGVTAINGASTVYFRNTFGDKESFDNIQVSAVPEPLHYALGLFGIIFVAVRTRRFWFAQLQPV